MRKLGFYFGESGPVYFQQEIIKIGADRRADINVSSASRMHAVIEMDGQDVVLIDMGSSPGTEVNGVRVNKKKIVVGDKISIGSTVILFASCDPPLAMTPDMSTSTTPVKEPRVDHVIEWFFSPNDFCPDIEKQPRGYEGPKVLHAFLAQRKMQDLSTYHGDQPKHRHGSQICCFASVMSCDVWMTMTKEANLGITDKCKNCLSILAEGAGLTPERSWRKTHVLKTHPAPYREVERGTKSYEVRKSDRDYQVGDLLILREWRPIDEGSPEKVVGYTGAMVAREVTYITKGGTWGLPEGLCILGIRPIGAMPPGFLERAAGVEASK